MSAILQPVPPAPAVKPVPVPAPEKPGRSRLWLVLFVIAVAAGIGYWQWTARRAAEESAATAVPVRTAKVVAGTLETTIRVGGQTSAREYASVTVPRMTGPESNRPLVILKMVPSGVMVKKGQVICEIDGQSMQDHIDDVHSTVVQSESDIKKRVAEQQVEWENLQQNVRVSKASFDKMATEAKAAEVRTVIDQELLKLSVEESEAAYKELFEETKLKKVSQAAELKILDFTRERHTRHRDRHKRDLVRFVMTSPMDGMAVVQTMWRGGEFVTLGEGDQVFPGQLVIKVVNPRSMQVEGNINQTESGRFRIGQRAKVSLDAFPGLKFEGKIYSIGAIAVGGFRQQAYMRNIPVRILIDGNDPRLIPDLSAAADVTVDAKPNSTVVPLAALRADGENHIAYVKRGNQFVATPVKIGDRTFLEAAVISGLEPGDEVALNYEPPVVAAAK